MDHGAYPAPLDYRGYRKSICTSINHVVCHGIPDDKPLREGDIVNIDVTLIVDGWHGDPSRMYGVGEIPARAGALIDVTYESLLRGIADEAGTAIPATSACNPGVCRRRTLLRRARFLRPRPRPPVPRRAEHPHYGRRGEGVALKPGMFFTIEPMINLGRPHVKILSDGWTAVTRDRSLSAQFEHTVGVTETGVEIFTLSPRNLDRPPSRRPDGACLARDDEKHYLGHRQRLRDRFMEAGDDGHGGLRIARTRPVPVDPAPRREAARQGAGEEIRPFAEAIAARPERLREIDGMSDASIADFRLVETAGRLDARPCRTARSCPPSRT